MGYYDTARGKEEKARILGLIDEEKAQLRKEHPALFFKPNRFQRRFLEHFRKRKPNGLWPYMSVASAANGVGKAIANSVTVPTPDGFKEWGSVKVGDRLFGADGFWTSVLAVYPQGKKDVFRVTFDDGSSTLVCKEHLWTVRGWSGRRRSETWETVSTEELLARGVKRRVGSSMVRQFEIPRHGAVQYLNRGPVDGYLMGVWLGDGNSKEPNFCKNDVEIFDELVRRGVHVEKRKKYENRAASYAVRGGVLNPYLGTSVSEKRVPKEFFTSSLEDRMDLLRGLMDTDGTVDKRGISSFCSSSQGLAEDVRDLVRSLGGKSWTRKRKTTPKYTYKGDVHTGRDCYITAVAVDFCPFLLPRKAVRWRAPDQNRYLARWIDSIEYSHSEEAMCVTVDAPDSLYLANDYIVTHNTQVLVALMAGCAFGVEILSEFFQGFEFFDDQHRKWAERGLTKPLHYRIICESGDMEESGELWKTIQAWFPEGRYTSSKNGNKHISLIECDNGVMFDVRTHDQKVVAHASSTVDGIFVNEPYPQVLHAEIVGRTRDDGFFIYALTNDKVFDWMNEQIYDDADGQRIVVEFGAIWDNCKDIPGADGHLSRQAILNMINEWEKLGPEQVAARVEGKPVGGSATIYPTFSQSPGIHIIDPDTIDPEHPIYCIMDPHDSKPPAIQWIEQGPHESRVVAEWPTEDYVRMGPTRFTIPEVSTIIKEIERNFAHGQVVWRFMDPNKGATPYANTGRTVQGEYLECGLEFALALSDDLQVGHARLAAMLFYNAKEPCVYPNTPAFRIVNHCKNSITALAKYGLKKKAVPGASLFASVDKKFKDFADLPRYYAVSRQPFMRVSEIRGESDDIYSGRIPK